MSVAEYKKLPDVAGIYRIWNTMNGKNYVGQTNNLRIRKNHHFTDLRCGVHHNNHLQNSWNKYGEEEFEFEILQICPVDELNNAEEYWIAYYESTNPEYGYNMEKGGDSNYTWSDETRKKIMEQVELRRQTVLNDIISSIEDYGGISFIISWIKEGNSQEQLCKELNISYHHLKVYLGLYGLKWQELYKEQMGYEVSEKIEYRGGLAYIINCITLGWDKKLIASDLGVSNKILDIYLDKFGLNYKTIAFNLQQKSYTDQIERFGGEKYFEDNIGIISLKEMAEEIRVPPLAIKNYMNAKNINF